MLVILFILIKAIVHSSNYIESMISRITNNQVDINRSGKIKTTNFAYALFKRVIDVSLSLFVMIYTLPLFILTSVLIKISSKGPVLFAQEKVGIDGKHFKLIKFRILRYYEIQSSEREDIELSNLKTKIGKIISALFIDEIPTLYNVVKGDLSLIGPRAMYPFIYERIVNNLNQVDLNRTGKSGLICLATFRAKRYYYSLDEYAKLDEYYLMNRSMKLDISILLTSIKYIFIKN